MASIWAARSLAATKTYASTGAALAATMAVANSSSIASSTTDCESSPDAWKLKQAEAKAKLRKRMTSVGHFSFASQTANNPSVSSFFLKIDGPFTVQDFHRLWSDRGMRQRHPRFHMTISDTAPGYFEPESNQVQHVTETLVPRLAERQDIQARIAALQLGTLNVHDKIWDCQIGTSPQQSILFFRGHHALGDGVSLFTAILDLCDEAEDFRSQIRAALKNRKRTNRVTWLQKLERFLGFWIKCLQAMLYQAQLVVGTWLESNPLAQIQQYLNDNNHLEHPQRTISYSMAAPVDEAKWIAQTLIGPKATINDVFVSCVSAAVAKQLEEHRVRWQVRKEVAPDRYRDELAKMKTMNIVMPVHLYGGVLLPGQSMGNRIGAVVAKIPGEDDTLLHAADRLEKVHDTLYALKQLPTPLLSYLLVRLTSSLSGTFLPNSWTQYLFAKANCNAVAVVTNVRGPPTPLHVQGKEITAVQGFVPLPPGVPIGVVVSSYAGNVKLSLTAEPWAVPNGDQFLIHVLEEYQALLVQAQKKASEVY